ncbi:MAG: c-type cytochrome [Candidatus Scalindua sp.]|nr:c-type cytochrome [Candidatus Scalindua sp.]MCR4343619.1 c-type cytochrome [Candidatus Scalindua sp.]
MRKKVFIFIFVVCFIYISCEVDIFAQATQKFRTYMYDASGKIQETEDAVDAGKIIYEKRCYYCHGIKGDGNGPAAPRMDQKPRNFTRNEYKIRSTKLGTLPTDDDLFRIISSGVEGTAMPFWSNLSKEERWQVIYYIKTFNSDFSSEGSGAMKIWEEVPSTLQTITDGKRLFKEAQCFLCHGENGRGDGEITLTMKAEWNIPFKARDLTKSWLYKGGNSLKDIYRTITTGINETPMGSYKEYLTDEERWHLAHYVKSISRKMDTKVVLKSKPIEGALPLDPDSGMWEDAELTEIPLAGQILVKPRLWNPSVNSIIIRSLYNKTNISFLLEWNDRTNKQDEVFSDAVAIQFPVKIPEGAKKPSFMMGDSSNKVYILHWEAHHQLELHSEMEVETGENVKYPDRVGHTAVEEASAKGVMSFKAQSPENQEAEGVGQWKDGRWRVLIKRPLFSEDNNDTQFEKGKLIPFSLAAWDGSSGEHRGKKAISSWYYLTLVTPTPKSIYGYIAIAVIMSLSVEFFFIARYRRARSRNSVSATDNE